MQRHTSSWAKLRTAFEHWTKPVSSSTDSSEKGPAASKVLRDGSDETPLLLHRMTASVLVSSLLAAELLHKVIRAVRQGADGGLQLQLLELAQQELDACRGLGLEVCCLLIAQLLQQVL